MDARNFGSNSRRSIGKLVGFFYFTQLSKWYGDLLCNSTGCATIDLWLQVLAGSMNVVGVSFVGSTI